MTYIVWLALSSLQPYVTFMNNLVFFQGHSVFNLTLKPEMVEILVRYQSEGANTISDSVRANELVEINFFPRKFWILTHIFFNSYTAMFRLHAMKELVTNKNLIFQMLFRCPVIVSCSSHQSLNLTVKQPMTWKAKY